MSENFTEARLMSVIQAMPPEVQSAEIAALIHTIYRVYDIPPKARIEIAHWLLEDANEALQKERRRG